MPLRLGASCCGMNKINLCVALVLCDFFASLVLLSKRCSLRINIPLTIATFCARQPCDINDLSFSPYPHAARKAENCSLKQVSSKKIVTRPHIHQLCQYACCTHPNTIAIVSQSSQTKSCPAFPHQTLCPTPLCFDLCSFEQTVSPAHNS